MRTWILVLIGASAIVPACSSGGERGADDSTNDAGSADSSTRGDGGAGDTCFLVPGAYVQHYTVTACDASNCNPLPDGLYDVDDAGSINYIDGGEDQFDDAGLNLYYGCHVTGGGGNGAPCVSTTDCAWGDGQLGWTETQTLTIATDHASLSGTMVRAFNDELDGGDPLGECDMNVKWTHQ